MWPFASSAAAGTSSLPAQTIRHLYGNGVDTPESAVWSTSNPSKVKDFDTPPKTVNKGDGDGTVNIASLKSVESSWSAFANDARFTSKAFAKQTHTGILANQDFLDELLQTLQARVAVERP